MYMNMVVTLLVGGNFLLSFAGRGEYDDFRLRDDVMQCFEIVGLISFDIECTVVSGLYSRVTFTWH